MDEKLWNAFQDTAIGKGLLHRNPPGQEIRQIIYKQGLMRLKKKPPDSTGNSPLSEEVACRMGEKSSLLYVPTED